MPRTFLFHRASIFLLLWRRGGGDRDGREWDIFGHAKRLSHGCRDLQCSSSLLSLFIRSLFDSFSVVIGLTCARLRMLNGVLLLSLPKRDSLSCDVCRLSCVAQECNDDALSAVVHWRVHMPRILLIMIMTTMMMNAGARPCC